MQLDGKIRFVINQESPVAPMAIRIAHQIVDDVHHVVPIRIVLLNHCFACCIMIRSVDFDELHRYYTVMKGGNQFPAADFYPLKLGSFINHLIDIKALGLDAIAMIKKSSKIRYPNYTDIGVIRITEAL